MSVRDQLERAAHELRRGHTGAGSRAVEEALAELARLCSLPANAEGARVLVPLLEEALGAQQRADWIGLADVLEHGLAALLE